MNNMNNINNVSCSNCQNNGTNNGINNVCQNNGIYNGCQSNSNNNMISARSCTNNCNICRNSQYYPAYTNSQATQLQQKNITSNIVADKHVMMKNIYELGFILTETNLYLDTHPDDIEAIEYYAQIRDEYCDYMTKYADYYGPLDKLHMSNDNYWMWVATPMPWEMEVC